MASFVDAQAKAPPELRNVAVWLRTKSGMKTRSGVLDGQRKDYFKGSAAVKAVLSPAYAKLKNVPKVKDEAAAIVMLNQVGSRGFYLRVERQAAASPVKKAPKILSVIRQQQFLPTDYYAWLMDGSQLMTYLGGLAMVAVIFAGVMFPLWPMKMRIGAWYLSMGLLGLLGLFFAIAIFRLIFYVITWIVASPGIWIFPQLFADVGFVESFIPLWEWDIPKKKKRRSKKGDSSATGTAQGGAAPDGKSSATSARPSVLPGMGPPPTPSFGSAQQAFIEEIPDES